MSFRLVTDDSCHWYAIPADKQMEFEKWVKSFEQWNEQEDVGLPYEGTDFNEFRLNTHISNYTFEGLKED